MRSSKLSAMVKKVSKQSQESQRMSLQANPSDTETSSKFVLLKWNHTTQPDRNMFAKILLTAQPADVTLECPDGTVKCHKVILRSCSAFFRYTLEKSQSDEPHVTILDYVNLKELYLVLHFIYFGYVHVRQYEIHKFLNAAKFLQIDGMNFPNDSSKYLYIPSICLQEVARKEYLETWENTSGEKGALCGTPWPTNEYHNEQNGASNFGVTSANIGECKVYDCVRNVIRNPPNNQYNKTYQVNSPCHASKGMNLDASTSAFFENQWITNTTVKSDTIEPFGINGLENNASQSSSSLNITKYNHRFADTSVRQSHNVPLHSPYKATPYNTQNMPQAVRPACSMGMTNNARSSSTFTATSAPPILSHLLGRYQPYTKSTISLATTNGYSVGFTTTMNNNNSDIYAEKHQVGTEKVLSYTSSNNTPIIAQSVNQVVASQYFYQGDGHCTSANLDAMPLHSSQDARPSFSPPTDEDEMSDGAKTLRGIWSCELFPEKKANK